MAFFRFDGVVRNDIGQAVAGASVYVCTQPAVTSSIPPSPLASIFSDSVGTVLANPVITDGNGNFFFYAATGTYTLVFFDSSNRIPTTVFIDQQVVTQGGGSVTSVGLTMPAEFAVAGSPIAGAGTLAVTKANQNPNTIYAGPGSGPAAAPGFRAMVTADLPAGTGTVTSVGASITPSSVLTASVSGQPIVGAGTLAFLVGIANQPANTVLAGPTSGGSGAVTGRALVPADLPGLNTLAFSATPSFDASVSGSFTMTLTGNVTSSSVINAAGGERITFVIKQDAVGGRTFAWPPNFKGASPVAPDANSVSVQEFIYDGANWRAMSPGLTTLS
jgi:hypothetical protein